VADAAASGSPSTPAPGRGFAALWARHAWKPRPDGIAWLLAPVALLYGLLAAAHRRVWGWRGAARAPVPVIVVGNLVAGGVGKTPVVVALVEALRARGWRPGVVSRGHGREGERADAARGVQPDDDAAAAGDEPLLLRRRTGVPVFVGRRRAAAAQALCAAHPEVDVVVADDGLQHRALAHDAALVVFDARGAGNGWLLPAGPLREPLPATLPPPWQVLYTAAAPSTRLPGPCALPAATQAVPLDGWWRGDRTAALPLAALRGRRLLALAGLGAPQKFFDTLRSAGLDIEPYPQPDHARYDTPPWPPGTREVVTTEKDAVKLRPAFAGATAVWVVPLDLALPDDVVDALVARLRR
jgi:tetraacyldisaccharide 4'-kinase